jgi:hypothetical protein
MAHLGRHVDDRSRLLRSQEPARHRLRCEKRRPDVQPHDGVEVLDAHLDERLRPVHAGVIEEHVVGRGALHGLLEGGEIGDIDGERVGRAAPLANLLRARFDLVIGSGHEGDVGACLGKGGGCGKPDAAPGAGDKSALAVEAKRRGGRQIHVTS